jgi:hypothetical protein
MTPPFVTRISGGAKPQMTQTQDTRNIPTPSALGLPPLMRIDDLARSGLHLSRVSPSSIEAAQASIRAVMDDMRYVSHSLNARACDDEFDRPNAADGCIEELRLALAALGGGS